MLHYGYRYDTVESVPANGPQPGTVALYNFLNIAFDAEVYPPDDVHGLGIFNPRDVCGNPWPNITCGLSFHARGRAGDCGVPVVEGGHPEGHRIADWLETHAEELGIQEIIWNRRRWDSRTKQWAPYTGVSPHLDHVHWAQCNPAAQGVTTADILTLEDEMTEADFARIQAMINTSTDNLAALVASQVAALAADIAAIDCGATGGTLHVEGDLTVT